MAAGDLTVGEVLSLLQGDFPEATMGWIRSLEDEHLIVPGRTPKGNRLFAPSVVETLRWILREQRTGATPAELRVGLSKTASQARDRAAEEAAEPRLFDDPSDILPPVNLDEDDDFDDEDDDFDDEDFTGDDFADFYEGDSDDGGESLPDVRSTSIFSSPTTTENPAVPTRLRPAQSTRSVEAGRETSKHPADLARRRMLRDSAAAEQAQADAANDRSSAADDERPAAEPPRRDRGSSGPGQYQVPEPSPIARKAAEPPVQAPSPEPAGKLTSSVPDDRDAAAPTDSPSAGEPAEAAPSTSSATDRSVSALGDRRVVADAVAMLQEPPSASPQPVEDRPRPARVRELGNETAPSDLLTREEFIDEVGITDEALGTLELYGVLSPVAVGGFYYYDDQALRVGRVAASFARLGLEARHLRMYRMAAEREVSLLEQLALPLLKQRNPVGREQAKATLREAAAYGAELHAALVAEGVRDLLGGSGN